MLRKSKPSLYLITLLISLISISLFTSCEKEASSPEDDLKVLPVDDGGEQIAYLYDSTAIPYGMYVYTPGNYSSHERPYPLLIFLHGSGEKGNNENNPKLLEKVLRNGPPKLIHNGEWNPPFPMIVVSPQCHENGWSALKLHALIEHIMQMYRVNEERIYMTGLSMGGYGTFTYLQKYGMDSYVAAAVPICGGGNVKKADQLLNTPIWAFHGDADQIVLPEKSMDMVNAINELDPEVRAKLTIYPGVTHDSWTRTYDGSGMGQESMEFDPFNVSIYEWLFEFKKGSNP